MDDLIVEITVDAPKGLDRPRRPAPRRRTLGTGERAEPTTLREQELQP